MTEPPWRALLNSVRAHGRAIFVVWVLLETSVAVGAWQAVANEKVGTGSLAPDVGVPLVTAVVVGGFLFILFGDTAHRFTKLGHSLLVAVLFVGVFATGYMREAKGDSACFSEKGVKALDAVYFTVGTLTTAGTGSLTPKSIPCRRLATYQMVLGVGLLGLGVGGVVAVIRDEPRGRRRNP